MDQSQELPPAKADQEQPGTGNYLEQLQSRLRAQAETKVGNVFNKLSKAFTTYAPEIIPEEGGDFMTDHVTDFKTLYDLETLGLLDAVMAVPPRQTNKTETSLGLTTIQRLDITRFGIALNDLETATKFRATLQEKMAQNQVVAVLREAVQNRSGQTEGVLPPQRFTLADQPLANAVVLSSLNLFGWSNDYADYVPGQNPNEFALNKLTAAFTKKAVLDNGGHITSVRIQLDKGVALILDPEEANLTPGDIPHAHWGMKFETQLEPYMVERANQQENTACEAFINRPTGMAFIDALQASHLRFSPDFENFILMDNHSEFDDRYGGAYAQLSRTLAKIIWSGDVGKLDEIIVSENGEPVSTQNLETFTDFFSADNGLLVFQKILRQIMTQSQAARQSDIPVTNKRISVSAGACFDVFGYYIQAQQIGKLYNREVQGQPFLEKDHGAHTFINAQPIMFKGVELPKGSLFVQGDDGGYAFLRLTPFTLENRDEMISAFGTEVLKGEDRNETVGIIQQRMGLAS